MIYSMPLINSIIDTCNLPKVNALFSMAIHHFTRKSHLAGQGNFITTTTPATHAIVAAQSSCVRVCAHNEQQLIRSTRGERARPL